MDVALNVRRFDPEAERPESYYQEFALEVDETATVLDGLIQVREEVDGTLAVRCSCRSAICGSCAMKVNGKGVLGCTTKFIDVMGPDGAAVTVEPAGNMGLIKDLVVEFDAHWDKIKAIEPWLKPSGPAPEAEYLTSDQDMLHLAGVMGCIQSGVCTSECTVLEIDENFLGPAALAKAYRFVADPRDDADVDRLGQLNRYGGIWDCTRCMKCVEACPKDVDPMGRIMAMRELAMVAGYTDNNGASHANAFYDIVKRNGLLNEFWLIMKTFGMFNIPEMLKLAPIGIKAFFRGKMPPITFDKIPEPKSVTRIFEKVEGRNK
jgi:succinate dehydrogenase / fumarate reductase iron-sulfur subunit